jgi:minor tail protein Z (GPZ)
MPVGFSIHLDTRQVEAALANVQNGVPRAATRAINRTLTTVRTRAAREIAADIGIPVRPVTETIVLEPATFQRLRGFLTFTGRRIPLIDLKAKGPEPSRGRGRGVSYVLGGSRRITSAFIATMRGSGHRGVFRRVGPSVRRSNRSWSKNLPIKELKGPSIPHVAAKPAILGPLKTLGLSTLARNVQGEIRFLLTGRRRDA